MKPRKILHITRIAKGGVPVVIEQLVNGYDPKRYIPLVLFDTPQSSDIRTRLSRSVVKTIDLIKPRDIIKDQERMAVVQKTEGRFCLQAHLPGWGYSLYLILKSIYTFVVRELTQALIYRKVIRENSVDLVHSHSDLRKARPEIIASKLSGVPCVLHRHGYADYNFFDRLFYRYVAKVIYISEDVANYHTSRDEKSGMGIVIHNGVNLDDFSPSGDSVSIRKEMGYGEHQPLIGHVARLDWWKGHEVFIEAIAHAKKQKRDIKGIIVGGIAELHYRKSEQYVAALMKQVVRLGMENNIEFLGHRTDVPRLLSMFDVIVHASSIPEPFGLTIIEGMAMSKPVVATAAGGVLDIIEDKKSGLLVPCANAKSMAEAIIRVLDNCNFSLELGRQARERVEQRFSIDRQIFEIHNLYDKVLGIG